MEEKNVDGESSAFLVLHKKEVESFADINENTENEEEIFECMIVE